MTGPGTVQLLLDDVAAVLQGRVVNISTAPVRGRRLQWLQGKISSSLGWRWRFYLVVNFDVCDVCPTEQAGDGGAIELSDVQLICKASLLYSYILYLKVQLGSTQYISKSDL